MLNNGDDYILLKNEKDLTFGSTLPCTLRKLPGLTGQGFTISKIERQTTSIDFRVTIKNPPPGGNVVQLAPYNGGDVSVAGGIYCHGCVKVEDNKHFVITNTAGKSSLSIPIEIIDDDSIPTPPTLGLPSTTIVAPLDYSTLIADMEEVYINAVNDGGGNLTNNQDTLPFTRNVNDEFIEDPYSSTDQEYYWKHYMGSTRYRKPEYWVIYIISAWQSTTDTDGDGDGEGTRLGTTYGGGVKHCELAQGGTHSFIWLEPCRDLHESVKETLAHEVGHQFGLSHGKDKSGGPCADCVIEFCPENMGLMCAHPPMLPSTQFIPPHKNLLRCRKSSPGNSEP